jgi:serine/threonine protein kinase
MASAPGGADVALKIIDLTAREGAKEFQGLQRVKRIRDTNLVPISALWAIREDGQIVEDLDGLMNVSPEPDSAVGMTADFQDIENPSQPVELIVAMGLGEQSLFARLKECRKEQKPGIPRDELLNYMEDAAKGIDFLNKPSHDLGHGPVPIIHGDVKPHNLLIVGGGVQVCDFGLARAVETLRKTTTGMGTCAYAAPELLKGEPHRTSDQYCLAISYVELCTGKLPFSETNDPYQVAQWHREGNLDLSSLRPGEREVIKRATALDPTKRWPSCLEMVRALRRACQTDELAASAAPPGPPEREPAPPAITDTDPSAGARTVGPHDRPTAPRWLAWLLIRDYSRGRSC